MYIIKEAKMNIYDEEFWNEQYNRVQSCTTNLYNITSEMKEHYYTRTRKHIELVQKYYDKNTFIHYNLCHDLIKFKEPELTPYIAIAWNYYCKDHNIIFEISNELTSAMNFATNHHVKNSAHHPEYWLEDKNNRNVIPKADRDKFDPNDVPTIDVTKTMPEWAIVEMCADWCAMSEERHNTPFEWVNKVIDKRWKFGKEKTELIHKVLNEMWN